MRKYTRYLGLDVHAETITAAIAEGRQEVRILGQLPNRPEAVKKLIEKLGGSKDLTVCYEAGPTGYALYWLLTKMGIACEVVAPSLIPKKSGDRIKNDRRDAKKLAESYEAGTLTSVWVPDAAHEALRDLVRARAAAKQPWWRWVQSLKLEYAPQQETLQAHLAEVLHQGERVNRFDQAIERAVESVSPERKAVIEALQALRGVAKLTAITIVTEIGTFQRFGKPTQLMGYTGLVPSEYSSGGRESKGRITRAGNAHLRHVLGETACHARHRPWLSNRLKQVLPAVAPSVAEIAWNAQERLHRKFTKLTFQRKPPAKVRTAVARELVGFVWAIGYKVEREALAAAA
jgi:transposase